MSQETSNWLNTMTLIGFVEKRGLAWHYRESDQGVEPNHYPGAVPVEDVLRRLFAWEAVKLPMYLKGLDGESFEKIADRVAVVRDDTRDVLGVFKDGYEPHQYSKWLLENVASILSGDELGIGSAGLLRLGAQAWVSVEVPENIVTPEGVEFRPHLLACTSFDGSLATTYKRVVTAVVCDNTLAASLGERSDAVRIKHTKYSSMKLATAREALDIVYAMGDDFAAEVKALCEEKVSPERFERILNNLLPVPDEDGRSKTIVLNKRDEINGLYRSDARVAPWNGTAFGVVQAFNTHMHHFGTVKGAERAERNMANAVTGRTEAADRKVLKVLAEVS